MSVSKSEKLAAAIAIAISRSMVYDAYEDDYQRISKAQIRRFIGVHHLATGIALTGGIWRKSWNITLDRMRHANAAKEATNWSKNRKTTSREEIDIIEAKGVYQVTDALIAGEPEMPHLTVQPKSIVDKLAVAITQELEDAMFFAAGALNAHILNEGDTKYRVQENNRSIWSNKEWPKAWKRVTGYLVDSGVLIRREKKSQFLVRDPKGIRELAENPSSVAMSSAMDADHSPVVDSGTRSTIEMFIDPNEALSSRVLSFGYVRAITPHQDIQSILNQMPENQLNKTFVEEYCPRLSPRPQWEQLIRRVKQGDTVVVANLFQLSRSIHESIEIIRWLVIHQVNLDVLNVGRLIEIGSDGELTPQSKSLINLYFAFEDFERTVIVDRAQSGKSSAKTRTKGYSDGRKPRLSKAQTSKLLGYYETHTAKETIKEFGISKATLYRRVAEARAHDSLG